MILKKDDYSISEDKQSITISQIALYRNLAECYELANSSYQNGLKAIGHQMTGRAAVLNDLINLFYEDDEQK